MDSQYYDGTKLLSMKDSRGLKPTFLMCTTNRTGGKTTYWNRYCVNRWMKHNEKFMIMVRFNYELDDIAESFFKEIKGLWFSSYYMFAEKRANGIFCELFIGTSPDGEDKKPCGYAVTLNNADAIKKRSHLFNDVERIIFDEFQSETNHYCPEEITKFLSILKSVSRGRGKQYRFVQVIMIANQVSIINPYYVEMGITERLREDTNFLKGDGYVLENGFIETASRAQQESGIDRAFKNNSYVAYSSENIYLNDNSAFLEKPESTKSKYIVTLRYKGRDYGLREYTNEGIIYCDDKPDTTFKHRLSITTEDHNVNYVMLKRNDGFVTQIRYFFEHGCLRFKDLRCKECILKLISY